MTVIAFVFMWLSSSWYNEWLCHLRFGFRRRHVTFIYVLAIRTSKVYTIKNKKSNQMLLVCYRTGIKDILITIITSNVYIQLSNI